ncbi:hypothetical protein PHLCEN_2v12405 [Hermanssonia centrifuga]|uniref:Mitochondrial carrier protein n=1 Tax=Hermanssonia centrifuga TaxID=98765 RepID=A0A2R6NHD6_9APHY|nr:hypothetical protein PHLCEN_2v12405 [Hermanssonia centrifuga]
MLLSVPEELGIGFIAGLASRAISTPLSVITVRLQTETEGEDEDDELNTKKGSPHESREGLKRGSIIGTVQRLSEEEGLQGFWRGFTTAIPLSLNPAITLFLFQVFRKISSRYSVQKNQPLATPSAGSAFLGAAFSNAISTILLYPLILAKTRLQVHRKQGASSETMFSIWKRALLREGIPGAYQGLEAQIVKGFVSQGITMMVKQR